MNSLTHHSIIHLEYQIITSNHINNMTSSSNLPCLPKTISLNSLYEKYKPVTISATLKCACRDDDDDDDGDNDEKKDNNNLTASRRQSSPCGGRKTVAAATTTAAATAPAPVYTEDDNSSSSSSSSSSPLVSSASTIGSASLSSSSSSSTTSTSRKTKPPQWTGVKLQDVILDAFPFLREQQQQQQLATSSSGEHQEVDDTIFKHYFVEFHGADEFKSTMPLSQIISQQQLPMSDTDTNIITSLLCTHKNGQLLSSSLSSHDSNNDKYNDNHPPPVVRIIIPPSLGDGAHHSVKWLQTIRLIHVLQVPL